MHTSHVSQTDLNIITKLHYIEESKRKTQIMNICKSLIYGQIRLRPMGTCNIHNRPKFMSIFDD